MCDSRDKPAEPDQTPGVFHHVFEFLHRFKIAKYHQHSRRFGAVTQREYGDERSAWFRAAAKFQRDISNLCTGPAGGSDHTEERIIRVDEQLQRLALTLTSRRQAKPMLCLLVGEEHSTVRVQQQHGVRDRAKDIEELAALRLPFVTTRLDPIREFVESLRKRAQFVLALYADFDLFAPGHDVLDSGGDVYNRAQQNSTQNDRANHCDRRPTAPAITNAAIERRASSPMSAVESPTLMTAAGRLLKSILLLSS